MGKISAVHPTQRLTPAGWFARSLTALLLAAVLLGLGLRWALSSEKMVLEYDDSISLLAATGHEGEYAEIAYAESYPLRHWVPASEWKRMIEPEPGRGLGMVARDLALYDIHPPLYFWLLAVWVRLAGSSLAAVHLLNLLLDAIISLTLYLTGLREWGSRKAGLLLAAAWALNPAALKTTPWVRQYILLALAVVGFAYLLYRWMEHSGKTDAHRRTLVWRGRSVSTLVFALVLLAVTAAGLMIHYYFALILLVGLLLAAFRLRSHRAARRLGATLVASVALAGLLFLALNPGLSTSVATYAIHKLSPLGDLELTSRLLGAVLKTNLLLFSPALLGLGITWLGSLPSGPVKASRQLARDLLASPIAAYMLAFSLLTALIITALFLAGIGPRHTMSSRYIGYLSPLVALIPIPSLLGSPRRWALPLFLAGMLVLGAAAMHPQLAQAQEGSLDLTSLRRAPAVLIDSMEWGTWPMAVQHLEDDALVYIEPSSTLPTHPESWLDGLSGGGVYVSILRGEENVLEDRLAVLDALAARYQVEQLSSAWRPGDWEITLYAVHP